MSSQKTTIPEPKRSTPSVIDCDKSHGVRVKTEYGEIEGFEYTAENGAKGNIFLGVPFASAPVDDLRFEKPIPPKKWTKTLETKEYRDSCVPYVKMWIQNPTFSEDCLYLNIMAPNVPSKNGEGHPVLVYIHGGGYCFGDAIKVGFDKITRQFVQKGVIVVTVPYRVGLYGFFSTGTEEAEGNYGLWDQYMALKFIHNNIKNFGGNPTNITLWGQSAGAGSVDALSLSPHSRGLFQKVYQSSGSFLNYWSTASPAIRSSYKIAQALGCNSTNPSEVKKFLKTVKFEDILEISSTKFTTNVTSAERAKFINFSPNLDNDFFNGKTIEELMIESPPKPTLMGLMSQEAGLFLLSDTAEDKVKDFDMDMIYENITGAFVQDELAENEAEFIKKDIIDFYFNPEINITDHYELLNRYTDIVSDIMFNQGFINEADIKSMNDWPIYFFIWDYVHPKVSQAFPIKGVFHCYELSFVFDQKPFIEVSGEDVDKIRDNYVEMMVNFVHTGNPSTKAFDFPKYDESNRQVLKFDLNSTVIEDPWRDRRLFWKNLNEKYNFNVLRQRTKQEIKNRLSW